ncbi:MAG: hypothetical protein RL238_583 [Actinomycetota bacterium]|jgi:PAS domain S-box-containing protein
MVVDHEDPECHGAYCTERMTETAPTERPVAETIAWHSSPIYVVWDVDGTVRSASESYAAYFGMQLGDIIGQKWPDLAPDEQALAWQQLHFALAALEREPIVVMDMPATSTGPTKWYRWTEWAIHDADGRIVQVRSTAVDVTELHEARAALASVIDAIAAARTEGRREIVDRLHQGAVQHLVAARWAVEQGDTADAVSMLDDALAAVRSSMDMLDAPVAHEVPLPADDPFWRQMIDTTRSHDLPEHLRSSVLDVLGSAVAVVSSAGAMWLAPNARGTLFAADADIDLATLLSSIHTDDRDAVAAAVVTAVQGRDNRVHWRFRHALHGWRSLTSWLVPLPMMPNEPRLAVVLTLEITPDAEGPAHDVVSVQLAERERLARDLHDDALQRLAGLRWMLSAADLDPEVLCEVDEVEAAIRVQLQQLHSGVARLGLRDALAHLVDETATPVTFVWDDAAIDVPDDVAEVLWRSAREGLRNVDRHARASVATLAVEVADDTIAVVVTDDGIGVDAGHIVRARQQGHLGVPAMREAALALGGQFELAAREGGGTRLRVELSRRS